jgi:cyclopropane-fatty-acyl-phospholipid synthase
VENLREHYAQTLRHWVARLEMHHEETARLVGEQTYRVWRLYMSGAAHSFACGDLGVAQLLLSNSTAFGMCMLPSTRADLYRSQELRMTDMR